MAKMKYWNGSQWVELDAKNADTVGGKSANDFAELHHEHSVSEIVDLPEIPQINDSSIATYDVWSADKIAKELDKKIDSKGHVITDNNYTDAEKSKLAGIENGANNYVHPSNANTRHVTDAEKTSWNTKETPQGAQDKADAATQAAKSYTDTKVAEFVNSAPETLDTLKELADALGNDPNFATTVATQIGNKADKVHEHDDYALKSVVDDHLTNHPKGFSGDYGDLTNKPTSMPADGGDADTIGGKGPDDFALSVHEHEIVDNEYIDGLFDSLGDDANELPYYTKSEIDNRLGDVEQGQAHFENELDSIKTEISEMEFIAEKVAIVDTANVFTATNVEDALLENRTEISNLLESVNYKCLEKDSDNGQFTRVETYRKNGVLKEVSELSEKVDENYTKQTVSYYDNLGELSYQEVFALEYDEEGDLIGQELVKDAESLR